MSAPINTRWRRPDGNFEPSPKQDELWSKYTTGDPDPHGWYNGWCPVHDREGSDPTRPTAQFNFARGTARCLGDPKCTERGTISLTNLLALALRSG